MFETARYVKDKAKLQQIMDENKEAYSSIDSETRDMLEVVANVRIPERCNVGEKGKERYDMCNAFEQMKLEGYEEGISKGIEKGIEKGIRVLIEAYQELGLSQDIIIEKCAEKYEMTKEAAGRYVKECCV